jgi:hypothetical protein
VTTLGKSPVTSDAHNSDCWLSGRRDKKGKEQTSRMVDTGLLSGKGWDTYHGRRRCTQAEEGRTAALAR